VLEHVKFSPALGNVTRIEFTMVAGV